MRSLCITLRSPGHITLPIAYNHYIHGALVECWKGRYAGLHGLKDADGKDFRPFVFGRLEGATRADGRADGRARGRARVMTPDGLVSFEVRSYVEEPIDEVAFRLASRGTVRLEEV